MPKLLLASVSRYRRELLARLGLTFDCRAPKINEDDWKTKGLAPQSLALELAQAKAASLIPDFPTHTILASDQVCACENRILSKPGTEQNACEQLAFLSGKQHQLITTVAIWQQDTWRRHTDVTVLQMRKLSSAEIERYVAADLPLDCAGSYRLELAGIALFESIVSADHTAIVGLPLLEVSKLLRELGFQVP